MVVSYNEGTPIAEWFIMKIYKNKNKKNMI
jgi:hypothetical protein